MNAVITFLKPASHHAACLGLALVVALGVFMILPVLQVITKPPSKDLTVRPFEVASLEPPPPAQMEEQDEPPTPEDPPPTPIAAAEPLSIDQMELSLNSGLGGFGTADFAVNIQSVAGSSEEVDAIFSLSDLDQKPRVVYQPAPIYPKELASKGLQGTVYVLFIVDKNGRTTDLKVQKSTHPSFNEPALKAVKQWKFEPGKRKGQPVQFRMRVPITFQK